jgi:hypothetical protein
MWDDLRVTEPRMITTDNRGRAVLPGHPDERFVLTENGDGSILLRPVSMFTATELGNLMFGATHGPRRGRPRKDVS